MQPTDQDDNKARAEAFLATREQINDDEKGKS